MSRKRDAIWTALDTFTSAGLSFLFRLLVARVLAPEEFGLAALALTIVAILQVINDFGLTAALIQRDERAVTPELVNTTFTASAVVSLLIAAATALAVAPVTAAFYHEPRIQPLVAVLAISLLPSPFTTVASALMLRRRRFKTVALVRVLATLSGLAVAGAVLLLRPSPWVIVYQTLATSAVSLVGLVMAARWRFRLSLRLQHLREVFGFSTMILLNDLTVSFSANAGVFILGRIVSTTDAGLFALAAYMTDTFRRALMSVLNRVNFVHYSQIKDDKAALARVYTATLAWNCRIIFPVMTAFLLFGPPLLIHFLGESWRELGSVVRWLCLSVMIHAAGGTTSTLYKAIGRPGLDMGLFVGTMALVLFPAMLAGAWLGGLAGVAIAAAASKFISIAIRQLLLDRMIGGTSLRVLRTVAVLTALQLPIVGAWLVARFVWPQGGLVSDVMLMCIGLAIYAAIEIPRALPSLPMFKHLKLPWLRGPSGQ
jgi:teichuronic acid exporter